MVFLFWEKWKLLKGKLVEKQGLKARRGTGRLWQVSFLYAQMCEKTDGGRFSVYREKQDEEGVKRREDFIK